MLVLAHRGANRLAPENTLPAMREALARGADGVELDVHRSADGALVVHHDAHTPLGPVGELSVAALRAGLPEVPLLAEVLDLCRGTLVNVEIKGSDPRAADAAVALLGARSAGSADDVLVSSFDLTILDRVRSLDPSLPTGFLTIGLDPHTALLLAYERGHRAVHPDVASVLRSDAAAFVERAHDLGVRVNVWTVNRAADVEQLRDGGVDGVITDDPDLYRFGRRGGRGGSGGVTGRPG
jgi:glycerophosphoryl diester phosphodiesterase